MKEALRQTRSVLMKRFQERGFHPRTDLGQNFLIDLNLIDFIVSRADVQPQDVVLEVGAGTGGMTTFLAQHAAAVVSVELDENMYRLAEETTAACDNVTLLHCDVLKNKNTLSPRVVGIVKDKLAESPDRQLKLVSNLPYNVATPVVSNLVASELPWKRMVVTIQLELGLKMVAQPDSTHYGALSVWLQSQCRVKLVKKLPPNVFWPRPKVQSAIVQLTPDQRRRRNIADRRFFQDFLRRLFHQRRKSLRSVLVGMYRKQLSKNEIDSLLEETHLSGHHRAERLDVAQLIQLSNVIQSAVNAATATPQQKTIQE